MKISLKELKEISGEWGNPYHFDKSRVNEFEGRIKQYPATKVEYFEKDGFIRQNTLYDLMKDGKYFDVNYLKENYLADVHWDDINHFLSRNPTAIIDSSNTGFSRKKLYKYELNGISYNTKTALWNEINDRLNNFIPTTINITYIEKFSNGAYKIVSSDSVAGNIKYQICNPLTGISKAYDTKEECESEIVSINNIEKNNYKNTLINNTIEIIGDNNNSNIKIKIQYNGQ